MERVHLIYRALAWEITEVLEGFLGMEESEEGRGLEDMWHNGWVQTSPYGACQPAADHTNRPMDSTKKAPAFPVSPRMLAQP